jgi:hypothetical protein
MKNAVFAMGNNRIVRIRVKLWSNVAVMGQASGKLPEKSIVDLSR